MEKTLTIEERMAKLEAIVNGDSLKRDMVRKATQYPKDYTGYLRTAEIINANINMYRTSNINMYKN